MAKIYVEVLEDGLTVGGAVRRAGDCVAVDGFEAQSKKDQVKRWGAPRYKEISKAEFEERGGVEGESLGAFGIERAEVAEVTGEVPPDPAAEAAAAEKAEAEAAAAAAAESSEFAVLEGLNVDDTLSAVAAFDDETVQRFILWEKANQNRKGVLEPLGASE